MPNDLELFTYDKRYRWSMTDGMTLERMFDILRLGNDLKAEKRLMQMGIYLENGYTYDDGPFLGLAAYEVEGIHRHGPGGRQWFISGRFRNSLAPTGWGFYPKGAWCDAYFSANFDSWSPTMNKLVTGKESLFRDPVRERAHSS